MRPSPGTPRTLRNLLYNTAYLGCSAVVTLLLMPWYAVRLGALDWGTAAFCITVQGVLFAVDAALGPLLLRDVGRVNDAGRAAQVYGRYLRYYARSAALLAALGIAFIIVHAAWRDGQGHAPAADLLLAGALAVVQFVFQFCNGAAIGYWNGLEQQGRANARLAVFMLARNAVAGGLLLWLGGSAVIYLAAFAAVSAIEFAINRRAIRSVSAAVPTQDRPLQPVPHGDVAAYAGAALLGVLTAQLDRLWLAQALPASDYGRYFLVSGVMLSLMSLQQPILRAYLPALARAEDPWPAAAAMLRPILVLVVAPSLLLALLADRLLPLWLGPALLTAPLLLTFRLLMLATALNALFLPVSAILLQQQRHGLTTAINAAILFAQILVLAWLTPRLGVLAGALGWLVCALLHCGSAIAVWRGRFRTASAR